MNFLLVNPWIYDSAAYDYWLKPIGLLYIGSILKKLGHDVELIDTLDRHDEDLVKIKQPRDKKYGTGKFYNVEVEKPEILKNIPRKFKRYGLPEELFIKKLLKQKERKVDGILVSVTLTYWYYGGLKTIEKIREVFPDTPIFLGGMYSNIYPLHAKKVFSKYDVKVCNGTGLAPIRKVLSTYNEVVPEFNWFEELIPAYELYNSNLPYVVITSSIGCPYNCSYCVTPRMWKYQYKSVDSIEIMISKIIKEKKVKDIVFFDDAFLLHKDLKKLLKMLAKYDVRYHLPNGIHAHRVTREIAELMAAADFRTIKLGYETSDPELQKKSGGKVTNQDLINAVKYLTEAGIPHEEIGAYIISNLPGQSVKSVVDAIDFCINLKIIPTVNEFTPIPQTPDYNVLIENGIIPDEVDPLLFNNTLIPYWWEKGMSIEEVFDLKLYLKKKKKVLINE